ncbi:DUF3265 domain-containing protein [Vibrio vulnificus]|nr:DUF3265 domain-containing protein [Vibrio vulnificus]
MTNNLRGIHAEWHFWFALSFVVKVACGKLVYILAAMVLTV